MRTDPVVSRFASHGRRRRYCRVKHVAMDKYTSSLDEFRTAKPEEAELVAQSVQADFKDLIAVLDHQLGDLSETRGKMRSHIAEARSAAARGLLLSGRLIEVLRASKE